jgi:glutathione S-transferase
MKLYYTPASPFARKVLMVAIERKLDDKIERAALNPWAEGNPVGKVNPAGKVPTLVTDDGMTLYDSPVICEYLDSLGSEPKLFPASGPARWGALRQQALADALLDAMIARRLESRRADGERSKGWMDRQLGNVNRCLDAMEASVGELSGAVTIGSITWLCALAHLDFRFADEPWRPGRPKLAQWHEGFAARPSVKSTIPHD